jgi:hypothetical protein
MPTLAIVSPAPEDQPVFEATFPQALSGKHNIVEQLVLNSSLDVLDETVRKSVLRHIYFIASSMVMYASYPFSNARIFCVHGFWGSA